MPGSLEFTVNVRPRGTQGAAARDPSKPLALLLLGDFSGRPAGERPPLAERPLARIGIDNFDDVLARFAPRADLGPALGELAFRALDDFHADALYRNHPLFERLRDLRARLEDPDRAAAALAELGAPPAADSRADADADGGALLGQLLSKHDDGSRPRGAGLLDRLIRDAVRPYIVRDHDVGEPLAGIDRAIAEQLRELLHAPALQALEADWRGVHRLVSELDVGPDQLTLTLLDVAADELPAALDGGSDGALARRLGDDGRWGLLLGLYRFGPERLATLAALGALASHTGAPLLTEAEPRLAGCASLTEQPHPAEWRLDDDDAANWQTLRASDAAGWIGLALPRVLQRLPYGERGEPLDAFAFEEFGDNGRPERHENYLWGSPACVCALAVGRAFLADGWDFEPDDHADVDDLPMYSYRDRDGEIQAQPCAELYLGDRAGEALTAAGLIPLYSQRHRNAVRIGRFAALSGDALFV